MNLIIHHGALGDWVVTFPLLAALAPQPTTVVAAGSKAGLAARLFPHVQAESSDAGGWSGLHAPDASPSARVRATLAGATRVFSFVSDGADAWAANVRRICADESRFFWIAPRPPESWTGHVSEWHFEQLRRQGLPLNSDEVRQRMERAWSARRDANDHERLGAASSKRIIVHPGSGGLSKCWPRERFEDLIHRLRDEGGEIVPILGEAEIDRWPPDTVSHWCSHLGARRTETLSVLCDVLCGATHFIGNDSGPTHLAAWLGLRTVALFGPSNPAHWAPTGRCVQVLRSATASMTGIEVEEVRRAVESLSWANEMGAGCFVQPEGRGFANPSG